MRNLFRRLEFHYWYFRQPPWDTGISPPELLEFIQNHPHGRAIDIGCGSGTNVVTLASAGWSVTGVDFAPRAIQLARQKVRQAGLRAELLVRDATTLQGIDGPFDFALDLGCFHGISRGGQIKYLEQLQRILARDGFWLMYGFIKPESDQSGSGLAQEDIDRVSARLTLISRRDGLDDGRGKPSAWFLFQQR
ncbi:MAG TPA: class I SAM-dependent methyltransferase [Anaerolineales bacterium]|nr:class I SAM-dependent methyltransferase [Anaerolineales bacterium]